MAILICAAEASAGINLKSAPQLWVYSTRGDIASVQALVMSNAFDKKVLGRALFHTLRRGEGDDPATSLRIARMLLSYGADVNYTALNGQTPLIVAASTGNTDAVVLLLQNGADPQAVDWRQKTALDYATSSQAPGPLISALKYPPEPKPVEKASQDNEPKINNMDLALEGREVLVTYDLVSPFPVCVALVGSTNKGASNNMRITGEKGDVGKVAPGVGKKISWNFANEYPKGFGDIDVLIDVIIEPCK